MKKKRLIRIKFPIKNLLVALLVIVLLTGCAGLTSDEEDINSSEKTAYKMGTVVRIKVYSSNSQPDKIIKEAFDLIEDLEQKMSLNVEASEVNKINKSAGEKPVRVSKDTYQVIEKALDHAKLSKGAFDPTIAPVVQLWGIGSDNPEVPKKEELKDKLQLVNYKNVKLYPQENKIFLTQPEMKLDVGGIAKGYAADRVINLLKKKDIKGGFISLGGNVSVVGSKPDGSAWKIGIQDPHQPRGEVMAGLELKDKTVVTSGSYERYFEKDGVRYHHILNPKTGYPAREGVISSTIIADTSINADALSTAVYVLGKDKGLKLINEVADTEALVVTEENKVYTTAGIKEKVEIIKTNKYQIDN